MGFGITDIAKELGVPLLDIFGEDGPGAPPFVIEQLTGSKIRIELSSRALPVGEAGWGVTQRTSKTTYQGNPTATQQVMGPEYPDTTIQGEWKERFIGGCVNVDGNTEITVVQLVQLFYRIAEAGNEVRVQWGPEVRRGVLKTFSPTWKRVTDVLWRMEFEWNSRTATKAKSTAASILSSADGLMKALNDLDDALAQIEDFPKAVTASLVTAIDNARGFVGKLFGLMRAFNTVLNLPGTLIGAIAAAVGSLLAELENEISRMNEASSQNMSISTRVSAMLGTEDKRRDIAGKMAALVDASLQLQEGAAAQANPAATIQVTTKEGETLYTLSVAYYGTPDMAAYLGAYNGISSGAIPPGTVFLIPPAPPPQNAPDPLSGGVVVHGR